jgi:hypothetical protein
LELYPDYWTQGDTEEELQINLRKLYDDLNSGELPGQVKQGVLKIT